MKVPIHWLRDYVDVKDEAELMDKLTAVGHMQDGPPKEAEGTNVYDLEVRQNRPDCLSLIGVAREAAAVLGLKVKYPDVILEGARATDRISKKDSIASLQNDKTIVKINDPSLCYRFNTVTLENLKVQESPDWLKQKLTAYGIKTKNNVVDITNFVMVETGQPLHAFDASAIGDTTIVVRNAVKGETLTILGGKQLELGPEDLVIADSGKPVAMAGIMGGEESGVTDKTTSIILEAATYNQATVRRASLRHNVRTEASTRLEKFLHPHLTEIALARAVAMLEELAGATVVDVTDAYPTPLEEKAITLSIERLNKLGGTALSQDEAKENLEKLELPVKEAGNDTLEVGIPYFRTDLELEEDLIEEVLRIYGYENIEARLPAGAPPRIVDSPMYAVEEQLRDLLSSAGLDEQITEPLTNEARSEGEPVVLQNSLNADKTMLRTTLKNTLTSALHNQQKYRKQNIKLFEVGRVYFKKGDEYKEERRIGVLTQGLGYADVKGIADLVVESFEWGSRPNIELQTLTKDTYFFELSIEQVKGMRTRKPLYEPPQIVLEDLSLYVPLNTKIGDLIAGTATYSSLPTTVRLGEEPQPLENKKSVFLKLEFTDPKKNLTKEQVDAEKKKIIAGLEKDFEAKLR